MTEQNNTTDKAFGDGDVTTLSSISGQRHTFVPGELIGNDYKLLFHLGTGGMGVVFACQHVILEKQFAIKILSGEELPEEYWTRFRAEAQVLAKLNHPGFVGIHNMGVHQGQFPYYVMDLLEGQGLDQMLAERGPIPLEVALPIFIQVADALGAAHSKEIVHRDIKPSNLMILSDQIGGKMTVKIVDFGIARIAKSSISSQAQTKTGTIFGSPLYMSPEQCQGQAVDARSDIYSLGCTIFECLTGKVPFRGENAFQTFMLKQSGTAPRLAEVNKAQVFPESVELVVAKMLRTEPDDRYQSAAQLKLDLERVRDGKAIIGQKLATSIKDEAEKIPSVQFATRRAEETSGGDATAAGAKKKFIWGALAIVLAGGLTLSGVIQSKHTDRKDGAKVGATSITDVPLPDEKSISGALKDGANQNLIHEAIANYVRKPGIFNTFFRTGDSKQPFFDFPEIPFFAIQFGDDPPIRATGPIKIPSGKRVCLYTFYSSKEWPSLLNKFTNDDLNGLETITASPDKVVDIVRHWRKLDSLSFFNSLVKMPPNLPTFFENSKIGDTDLPLIDKQLPNLKSIGLCNTTTSGKAIAAMRLFKTVHTLKVSNIADSDYLLDQLPSRNNIHELWLVNIHLTDNKLEPLTHMKKLEVLRIRRSELTRASLKSFTQMKTLRELWLDPVWPEDRKKEFQKAFPKCHFEPATDRKYWIQDSDVDKLKH